MKKSVFLIPLLAGEVATSAVISSSVQVQEGSFLGLAPEGGSSLDVNYFDSDFGDFDGSFIVEINPVSPATIDTFEFGASTIGRVPRIYLSDAGSLFGRSDVTPIGDEFTPGFFGAENFLVPVGDSIFFNYWFDQDPSGAGAPTIDDNFGWFELQNTIGPTGPSLQVLDSAVSTQFGIITGTTQVPEPSTVVMSVLGVGLLLIRRRR